MPEYSHFAKFDELNKKISLSSDFVGNQRLSKKYLNGDNETI